MATATDVLNHFRSELGTVEGPNNSTEYAAEAGHANHQPWCATFVVAMFRRAGMTLPSESAYTPTMRNGLKDRKREAPEVGALAFLYFPKMKRVAHVGIVESLRPDGRFVTIEGNTDSAGGRTGGRVMRKVRSTHNFTFYMPAYSDVEAPAPAPTPPPAPPAQSGDDLVFPVLRRGSKGQHVRNLQGLLVAAGRRVEIDGIYGPATERVVRKYQEAAGLAVDGLAGTNTFRRLLGV